MKLVQVTIKPEPLPKGWAENLINTIIWGDDKFYKPKRK